MKKISILLVLCSLLIFPQASAKEFSGDRWHWAYSNHEYSGFIDKDTLKYDPQKDQADAFVRWEYPLKQVTRIYRSSYYYKTGSVTVHDFTEYSYDSDSGIFYRNSDPTPFIPAPGSGEERVIAIIASLVDRNGQLKKLENDKKELEAKKKSKVKQQEAAEKKAAEEKAEEEKQKAEETEKAKKQQKQKEVLHTGLEILGSIWGL